MIAIIIIILDIILIIILIKKNNYYINIDIILSVIIILKNVSKRPLSWLPFACPRSHGRFPYPFRDPRIFTETPISYVLNALVSTHWHLPALPRPCPALLARPFRQRFPISLD